MTLVSPSRPIFLFHIWKTGGTSIVSTFRRALGAQSLQNIEGTNFAALASRVNSLTRKKKLQFFYAHVPPLPVQTSQDLVRTVVVRDPIDRMISQFCFSYNQRHFFSKDFQFFRRCRSYNEGHFFASDVEKMITEKECDNMQTRFLAWHWGSPVTEETLETAKRALDSCDLVGVTERLGHYLAVLSVMAGLKLDVSVRTNRTSKHILRGAEADLREALVPYHTFDIALHKYAQAKFEEVVAKYPDAIKSPLLAPPVDLAKLTIGDRIIIWKQASFPELWVKTRYRFRQGFNRLRDRSHGPDL